MNNMSNNLSGLILLPRLRVQNANAISGPLSWGFPSPTAFTGFVHALERKLKQSGQLSDGFAGAMAQIGSRTQSAQFAQELSASFAANLERDRTAVSGVNLDEEAARLIQYQQAYQASAKMIQIAQNVFDTLITSMGR